MKMIVIPNWQSVLESSGDDCGSSYAEGLGHPSLLDELTRITSLRF